MTIGGDTVPKSPCSRLAGQKASWGAQKLGRKSGNYGVSLPPKEAMPWGWSTAQVHSSGEATTARNRIAVKRREELKKKAAAWEVPTLNDAVFNWHHQGLCVVSTLFVFITESPNSTDLKGIWLFYINHKLYSRGWEQSGRYPGVAALRSSHYNHPANQKKNPKAPNKGDHWTKQIEQVARHAWA